MIVVNYLIHFILINSLFQVMKMSQIGTGEGFLGLLSNDGTNGWIRYQFKEDGE